jgi:hypothetical protein
MSGQRFSFISKLVDAVKRNPRRAIFAVAVISVLVGCYPVVFFGRSFVSTAPITWNQSTARTRWLILITMSFLPARAFARNGAGGGL